MFNILELDEVKRFLKVDYPDEDEDIKVLIEIGIGYLEEAIGRKLESLTSKQKLYCKYVIKDFYEDRSLMQEKNVSDKVRYTLQSLLLQIKYGEV